MFENGSWKKEARDFYDKKYYINNDDGHKINHADDVYLEMLRLNLSLKLNLNEDIIFMIAYVHDIYTMIDRKNHHTLAMNYVVGNRDIYLERFDPDELWVIAQAVNEHRASGSDYYSNEYSRIARLADKGVPDLNKVIERSYLSTRAKHDGNLEKTCSDVYLHLWDKYSKEKGYGFKSDDYRKVYAVELEEFWQDLEGMNVGEVYRRVELGLEDELCFK